MNNKKLVQIGSFIKHHGLKGELKVFLYNENSKTLVSGVLIWIKEGNKFSSYTLESVRGIKNRLLVKFKDINSRESSEHLIKKNIYVSRLDFPDLDEGFYINDIIGFNIENSNGEKFGLLKDVLFVGDKEILLVEFLEKEIMIPNVNEFVKLFDFENEIVIVDNMEQFID